MDPDGATRPRNKLLAALPPGELRRLRAVLEPVDLPVRETLAPGGSVITHAYFVENGIVSLVQRLSDGSAVEVGMIGREGFFGVPLMLGARTSPAEANIQLGGSAMRITAKALQDAVKQNKQLHSFLLGFTHALYSQVTQTAACNGRHDLQQRLARWLSSARDRSDGDELAFSHEFLSMMLGRRRAGVTITLGKLRKAGVIDNFHGRVRITDRRGLENLACECYRVVRDEYRRVLP